MSKKRKKVDSAKAPAGKVAEINQVSVPAVNLPVDYECLSNGDNGTYALNSFYYNLYNCDIFQNYTRDNIRDIIRDPIRNNRRLRDISKILYSSNGVYTNTVDYLESMPTLDFVVTATGKSVSTKTKLKNIYQDSLKQIKHKEIIRDMLHRAMIEGIAFYYCEKSVMPETARKYYHDLDMPDVLYEYCDTGLNLAMIPLPVNYTKIHHTTNGVYTLAFDMRYFLNGVGTEEAKLLTMPSEIRDKYRIWRDNRQEDDDTGCWCILDWKNTLTLKIRSDKREPWGRPLCLAAISDILYSDYFTDTKRNVLNGINNEVWIQTFPEGKEKGQTTLTKKQQEAQHNTVSRALKNKDGKNDRTVISIMAGTKIDHVSASNVDLLDDKYESDLDSKIAMYLGIAGSLLSGSGSGSYSAQQDNLKLVSMQLFAWIEQIQNELNKVLNYNIIVKRGYKVEVNYLNITFANRKECIENFKELYTLGKGPIQTWVAASGMNPDVFLNLVNEENEVLDWNNLDKYPIHATSFNFAGDSTEENTGGRPETDNPSDLTIANRNVGGNDAPRPGNN